MDDATLVLDRDMGEPETHRLAGGCAAVFSARSPGKETPNEDAAALLPVDSGSAVLAVADGLGGERAGEEAAALAVQCLADALEPSARSKSLLRDAILNGFEREVLLATLKRTGWNVRKAAKELGLSRAAMYTRLNRFRITRDA